MIFSASLETRGHVMLTDLDFWTGRVADSRIVIAIRLWLQVILGRGTFGSIDALQTPGRPCLL